MAKERRKRKNKVIKDTDIGLVIDSNSTEDKNEDYKMSAEKYKDIEEEYVLYAIIDKNIPGLIDYMRESGLNISRIFLGVEDARNTILMQYKPTRIVIIETGMGVFTATKVRQEIIDIMSLSGEDSKITIFYVSSVLKSDALKTIGKDNKDIEWVNFKNIVTVIANILLYNEVYIADELIDEENKIDSESILNYKGMRSEGGNNTGERIVVNGFSSDVIVGNLLEKDESIQKYTPHI